ncbi:uncharacterized protein LOC124918746 [Impatiens glandulifera]|uniref:uncharacterized protein LOC124918746 n=1 Tax=Impatiens glandulifera TaxID=253017 RepID=UPI001FB0D6D5|nr:uncharacterized protein LOC124918746 [Impatiens glandulifera]
MVSNKPSSSTLSSDETETVPMPTTNTESPTELEATQLLLGEAFEIIYILHSKIERLTTTGSNEKETLEREMSLLLANIDNFIKETVGVFKGMNKKVNDLLQIQSYLINIVVQGKN